MSRREPPRLATWLLARLLPEEGSEAVLGDLHEVHAREIVPSRGRVSAWCWYWVAALKVLLSVSRADVVRTLPPPGFERHGGIFPNLNSDIRHGVRQLIRAPGFTATAIALLSVSIAINGTVFSFVDSLIVHPVPGVQVPKDLVSYEPPTGVRPMYAGGDGYSAQEVADIAGTYPQLQGMSAAATVIALVDDGTAVTGADVTIVLPGYLATMRPILRLGRLPEDQGINAIDQVLIGYDFWQQHFGGAANAVGQSIEINHHPFTVTGVTGPAFERGEVWVNAAAIPLLGRRGEDLVRAGQPRFPTVVARRRGPQVSLSGPVLGPDGRQAGRFVPMGRSVRQVLQATWLLRYLAFLILLVAATNVSLLLVGRGIVRRREIAVRLALGASRTRLVRLLLVESVLLGTLACGAALCLTAAAVTLLRRNYPASLPDLTVSWRVVLASAALAVLTSLALGLLPALHATTGAAGEVIKASTGGRSRARSSLQRVFVVFEVALSMCLAAMAILLYTTIHDNLASGSGFQAGPHLLITDVGYNRPQALQVDYPLQMEELGPRLRNVPGVTDVAFALSTPMGYGGPRYGFVVTGDTTQGVRESFISRGYFAAFHIPILAGRDIPDDAAARDGVWIDEGLARSLWPGRSALGRQLVWRQIRWDASRTDTVVVQQIVAGVVGEVVPPLTGGRHARQDIYLPLTAVRDNGQRTNQSLVILATVRPGSAAAEPLSRALRVTADLIFPPWRGSDRILEEWGGRYRAISGAAAATASFALLMAFAGLYALVSFGVGQRTREIGVRMALGARQYQVLGLFFREGFGLALIGFVIGVPMTLLMLQIGLDAEIPDELLQAGVVVPTLTLLLGVAACACLLPAWRAMQVSPVEAIRGE